MSSRTLQCEVLVLSRGEPRESCTPYMVLCPEAGVLSALQRRGRGAGGPPLDLFDSASLQLSGDDSGGPWFVKEAQVTTRRPGIAARYEALDLAGRLTTLIARNPLPEDGRAGIHTLASRALDAFASHPPLAECVYIKACFSLARDEGYPVRQQWMAELHGALREEAEHILACPLSELAGQPGINAAAAKLLPRLDHWIREHTDLHFGRD